MSGKFFYIQVVLLVTLLTSCEEEYILDTDSFKSRIVVNSIFTADEPWELHLSNTHNILDPQSLSSPIVDAKVEIYSDKGIYLYDLTHTASGNYTHVSATPTEGSTYLLKVYHDDYPDVKASGFCPLDPDVEIGGFERRTENGSDGLHLDFEIHQKQSDDNFYMWQIRKRGDNSLDDFGKNLLDIGKSKSKKDIYGDLLLADYDNKNVSITVQRKFYNFSDNIGTSNGKTTADVLNDLDQGDLILDKDDDSSNPFGNAVGISNGSGKGKPSVTNGHTYQMKMITLSQEVYDYLSYIVKINDQDPAITSSNGYIIYESDIEGGVGIFAGINTSIIQF